MFRITNCNEYHPPGISSYEEYSMVYTSGSWIGKNPGRNYYKHRQYAMEVLRNDIGDDINDFIQLGDVSLLNNGKAVFSIFVLDHELSTMIKLTYS